MSSPIETLAHAADGLAEALGVTVAAHDRGETLSQRKIEHARNAILLWHQIKHKELERARSTTSNGR